MSCAKVAKDGTVYVCDRGNNRIQVFDKTGKFLKQGVRLAGRRRAPARCGTSRSRAIRSSATSTSPTATIRRSSSCAATRSQTVGSFGDGGRYPGTFYSVGSVAVDSKGNIYTGENLEGKRVQKFMPKGGGTMQCRCRTANADRDSHRCVLRRRARWRSALVERALERAAVGAGEGRVHGAALRSRSAVAEAAAEPLGARPGDRRRRSTRRITSGSSIATTCSTPNEAAAEPEPADRVVLRQGAAGPRVRSGRQRRRPLGRPGRGLRLARRRTTASPSTTRATSGSAATAGTDCARC